MWCVVGLGCGGRRGRGRARRGRASTWWWSRPAATTPRRTSTAPSCPGYARLYLNGGGVATEEPEHGPARGAWPGRRHRRELHVVLPPARPRARALEAVTRALGMGRQGLRRQPRRRRGADRDQALRAAPPEVRPRDAKGPRRPGLALRGDAAQFRQGLPRRRSAGSATTAARSAPKQSTMKTWLQDAYDNGGANIPANTPVDTGDGRGRAGGRWARKACTSSTATR